LRQLPGIAAGAPSKIRPTKDWVIWLLSAPR
jgi:hypothetical protein